MGANAGAARHDRTVTVAAIAAVLARSSGRPLPARLASETAGKRIEEGTPCRGESRARGVAAACEGGGTAGADQEVRSRLGATHAAR
jgi:hypothetical protein